MKVQQLFGGVGLAATLLVMGCSSLQTSYDYSPTASFTTLHTYSFAANRIPTAEQNAPANPILDERIKTALSQALQAKNFVPATTGQPDFTVAFVPASKRITTTESVGGWNYNTTFPVTFLEGTLLVHVIDTKTGKMIWRGSATDALSPDLDPEKIQRALNAAAKSLFKNFPPPAK